MAVSYTCVRCGDDANGLLFCLTCAPTETLQQDVTITLLSPGRTVRDATGQVIGQEDGHGVARIKAAARPDPSKKPERTAVVKDAYRHDRQQMERCTIYKDRADDLYIEVWQEPETGEVTYLRRGPLSDQEHHGERTRTAQRERRGE